MEIEWRASSTREFTKSIRSYPADFVDDFVQVVRDFVRATSSDPGDFGYRNFDVLEQDNESYSIVMRPKKKYLTVSMLRSRRRSAMAFLMVVALSCP